MNGPKTQMMRPTKPDTPVEPVRYAVRLSVDDRQIGRVEAWDRATALRRATRIGRLSGETAIVYAELQHETGDYVPVDVDAAAAADADAAADAGEDEAPDAEASTVETADSKADPAPPGA